MMERQAASREVFRRSWLTLIPEWSLAASVALAVAWAAHRFGLQAGWEWLYPIILPFVWGMGRTLLWTCCTWTVTADGRLIVQEGMLFRHRRVIPLRSVWQFEPASFPLSRWLDIGHITLLADDSQGQMRSFQWTWLEQHSRLCEIVQARGHLPIGRPSWWQLVGQMVRTWLDCVRVWLVQERIQGEEIIVWLQGHWFVDDYERFLRFCSHMIRHADRGRCWPSWAPRAVVRRWMTVLRQARIVVDSSDEKGWRLVVRDLVVVCRRVGPEELRRAVQQPIGPGLRQTGP